MVHQTASRNNTFLVIQCPEQSVTQLSSPRGHSKGGIQTSGEHLWFISRKGRRWYDFLPCHGFLQNGHRLAILFGDLLGVAHVWPCLARMQPTKHTMEPLRLSSTLHWLMAKLSIRKHRGQSGKDLVFSAMIRTLHGHHFWASFLGIISGEM